MRALVVPIVIAVIVSLLVVVAAAFVSPEGQGIRGFFRDLKGGLSDRFGAGRGTPTAPDAEPIDTGLEEFFNATATEQDAYVGADRLANTIEHVVDATRSRTRH